MPAPHHERVFAVLSLRLDDQPLAQFFLDRLEITSFPQIAILIVVNTQRFLKRKFSRLKCLPRITSGYSLCSRSAWTINRLRSSFWIVWR
mmetsp:Transcript_15751/g.28329  ORF Transcript_15751/g.28329 Transcript_15751/m.28329 type:complete len:90 (-) Transcript_15751:34-303(-)